MGYCKRDITAGYSSVAKRQEAAKLSLDVTALMVMAMAAGNANRTFDT
jgi:hypothetical protein